MMEDTESAPRISGTLAKTWRSSSGTSSDSRSALTGHARHRASAATATAKPNDFTTACDALHSHRPLRSIAANAGSSNNSSSFSVKRRIASGRSAS